MSLLRPLCQHFANTAAKQSPAPNRTALPPSMVSCRASQHGYGTGVLDRPSLHEQEQQPADIIEDGSAYEVLQEPSGDMQWEREFSDYAAATEMMNELESLQAELISNESAMDSLWFASPPSPQQQQDSVPLFSVVPSGEDAEKRRAARRASREARKKAQMQALQPHVQQQAAVASSSLVAPPPTHRPPQTAAPAIQPPSPAAPDLSADLESLEDLQRDLRAQLTQLQEQQPLEKGAELSSSFLSSSQTSSKASVPSPPPLSQTSSTAPSLVLSSKQETTTFAAAASQPSLGPSLSLLSSSASSSSAARARHQRRAERYSPRSQASTVSTGSTSKGVGGRSATVSDSTTQFMKAASSVALLQGNEQKELATVVKDYLLLMRIKSELRSILKRDPDVEEWAKAAKMEPKVFVSRLEAGQAAKSVMVKSNYRLVVNIVNKYRGRGMEINDLIAEGMHGLLRGVEKFDADKGFRFSTYAHWWIRQSVSRAISNQTRTVRVPYHMQELLLKVRAAKSKFLGEHNRPPTDEEVAAILKVPVARITQAIAASISPKSLDAQINDGDDGGGDLKDQLADDRCTPEEMFAEEQMQESVMMVLRELDEREAGIVRMRLGIDGSDACTLEEIGRTYNVTRERVRQVEAKAMHKLQELAGGGNLDVADYSVRSDVSEKDGMVARSSRGTHKS